MVATVSSGFVSSKSGSRNGCLKILICIFVKDKFRAHLIEELQIPLNSHILVAVSGGIDSVALLDLLHNAGLKTGVAHANFQLRGNESDREEFFVKSLADKYGLPFYSQRFETKRLAGELGISTQMAARQLRYDWFEELVEKENYDFVAIAHHMDDQIETFFINLLRGTGISGLKGIPAKTGNIIRPLLPFYRSEIEEYVRANRLDYREDSSNFKTEYLRNRIRHQLIQLFDELQPSFRKIMAGNIANLTSAEFFFRDALNKALSDIIKAGETETLVSVQKLRESGHAALILHEVLQPLGFSTAQTQQILQAMDSQPGKTFCSRTHRLVKDRDYLIVHELDEKEDDYDEFVIEKDTGEILRPIHLQFQVQIRDIDFQPVADPNKAFLDNDTIHFPLKLRKWKQGDRFKPLGMKGHMKLSDFFVANKFSLTEKENTWLLTDTRDEIIWIAGHRIAQANRIKPGTKSVLAITWIH